MSTSKFLQRLAESKIKKLEIEAVEQVAKDIEKDARRNFRRATNEIPADDQYIDVQRIVDSKTQQSVVAIGTQVLFVEFGAGIAHSTETSTVGFNGSNIQKDRAERPVGIYDIGGYGQHRGLDDVWFYRSTSGRESKHAHLIGYSGSGYKMVTSGIRPIRALWRARNSALSKLSGKRRMRRLGLND